VLRQQNRLPLPEGLYAVLSAIPALGALAGDMVTIDFSADHPVVLCRSGFAGLRCWSQMPVDARRVVDREPGGQWVKFQMLKAVGAFGARRGDVIELRPTDQDVPLCLWRHLDVSALLNIPQAAVWALSSFSDWEP